MLGDDKLTVGVPLHPLFTWFYTRGHCLAETGKSLPRTVNTKLEAQCCTQKSNVTPHVSDIWTYILLQYYEELAK